MARKILRDAVRPPKAAPASSHALTDPVPAHPGALGLAFGPNSARSTAAGAKKRRYLKRSPFLRAVIFSLTCDKPSTGEVGYGVKTIARLLDLPPSTVRYCQLTFPPGLSLAEIQKAHEMADAIRTEERLRQLYAEYRRVQKFLDDA